MVIFRLLIDLLVFAVLIATALTTEMLWLEILAWAMVSLYVVALTFLLWVGSRELVK